jgi:hypothetical protein
VGHDSERNHEGAKKKIRGRGGEKGEECEREGRGVMKGRVDENGRRRQ